MSIHKQVNVDQILPLVRKPGRYIGGELNAETKAWQDEQIHFCLVFPDLYEIGMSHQGLQILYHILNSRNDSLAHRCYTPDIDMAAALKEEQLPLFSLEARLPLQAYDVVGFTLPYELCYTNILTVLDLAGIPFYAAERGDDHPLVLGGGAGALNPEPVADFFDAIILGDGEEIIAEVSMLLAELKAAGVPRREICSRLARVPGVYVPSLFRPRYEGSSLLEVTPLDPDYSSVSRRVIPEMHAPEILAKPLVPVVKPVHDRLGIEIARGCTRGCRFCQAGIIYRPVRERSREEIMEMAEAGIKASGFDELALLSLSSGDYSCIAPLLTSLMDRFAAEYVSVSMPSMRVGTLTPTLMDQIKRVRKTGFTVAPEAGTDRLREVINKGISEEDLLTTCRDAFSFGWKLIKFYFMIGLPTETREDLEAIVELVQKARLEAGPGKVKQVTINVSVGTFVPKPHTPFQWEAQLSMDESLAKISRLKELLPRKGFALKWHDARQSYLEGVFSRGDRRLAPLLIRAWEMGARLDGWSEHFNLERWQEAALECGLDLDDYLRARALDEILPWDHLKSGVGRDFLLQERERALERSYTKDCRVHGCQQCGLCDFSTLRPQVHGDKEAPLAPTSPMMSSLSKKEQGERPAFSYRVDYARLGDSRFYGHLEILQLIFRVLQRAELPLLFSQGFNPSPKVSFSQALPVGMESLAEFFEMELASPLNSLSQTVERLNSQLPPTIRVSGIKPVKKAGQASFRALYRIEETGVDPEALATRLQDFSELDHLWIERIRKRKKRQLDLRPLVESIGLEENILVLALYHYHGQAGTNPREILEHGLGLSPRQALLSRITKLAIQEVETPA
ncbi:TIGR03960 family B12-binding radical SAM protein [Desulfogranum mediterraneum]|uniref:TIGR03960 family B12-binding radical SAM protein n=1 Tax=Desulfogranum mediterraneum TaxID=160661 RepID=UPI00040CC40B|nr:TIGR03960 family B12-binding radical SAM protein [Desulfogranum mediterraneum]